MTLPIGYTRGEKRVQFLREAIEAIEDGLATAAGRISYPNAGEMDTLSRADAIARLRLLYATYAQVTNDPVLAREASTGATLIRVISGRGYRGGGGIY
ncbi:MULTISPECIES: hypothetical protein [unclassified Methylobacterium]|uniref:hypothetical protein n=1 Tax=unclassified Methylobacterium TaxID=2615210 RepID=UPI001355038B|nr:hypothetical protein [Methylobacterium sp. 2A]MWV22448.1 hypothetical protein [Methylobacterium sp. 2A]